MPSSRRKEIHSICMSPRSARSEIRVNLFYAADVPLTDIS
jgi:hypothetical protein